MRTKTYLDYITYSPEIRTSATGLADSLPAVNSHDEVTRWLAKSKFDSTNLWAEVGSRVDLEKGYLVIDDTIIAKPHSDERRSSLVGKYWSDGAVKGINLVQMLWVKDQKVIPIDFHIVDKTVAKTKNEIAREMLKRAHKRGFRKTTILFDSWYGANETLQLIGKLGYTYVTRFKKNRRINSHGINVRAEVLSGKNVIKISVPSVGSAKVLVTGPGIIIATNKLSLSSKTLLRAYRARWKIEEFFRAVKQVYRLAGCQSRRAAAWRTHIYASILAFARNALAEINHYQLRSLACQKMLGGYLAA